MRATMVMTLAMAVLTGCSGGAGSNKQPDAAGDPPYDTSMPTRDYMQNVWQHAAEAVWNRTGYITDDKGFRSLFPRNDAEWTETRNASLLLAQMTNELLIPGRRVPEKEWDTAVVKVRQAAMKAAEAAAKKDEEALMAAGLEINDECAECHEHYNPGVKK